MGSWAVMHALSVGIFPYVLRLLQSPAADLRRVLVFIWTKILAFDLTCQVDLVKDKGQKYFLAFLNDKQVPADHRVIACFVLCAMCAGPYKPGQLAVLQAGMLRSCLVQLALPEDHGPDVPMLLRWLCLCVAACCDGCDAARAEALRGFVPGLDPTSPVHNRSGGCPGNGTPGQSSSSSSSAKAFPTALQQLLRSADPELRAAAVHALGKLFGGHGLVETWSKSQAPLRQPVAGGSQTPGGGGSATEAGGPAAPTQGVVSVAYAGQDRQALPLGVRAGTVVLAAEYTGGGGGAGDSAAAVLPGSRLISIDGQSVGGLSLASVREIAEEAAPTTLQFDGSSEADEWAAKEMAVAWIMIHSLYDADGAVRTELANGLAQFVAHHIDALLEALSGNDDAEQAGEPASAETTALRHIWSCVLTLRADPLPSVAERAGLIWVYVTAYRPPTHNLKASSSTPSLKAAARTTRGTTDDQAGGAVSAVDKPADKSAATLGSSSKGGMTRSKGGLLGDVGAIQRSQSMMLNSATAPGSPAPALSSLAEESGGESSPVPSPAQPSPAAQPAPVLAPPVKKELADTRWLGKFTSTLYDDNCKHFMKPLMKENVREPDPALLQAKRWRWERSMAKHHAQQQRSTGVRGGVAEQVKAISSFDNQLPSLNNESSGASRLMFHPTQPYLLVADEEHTLSVWDYTKGRKVTTLDNGNPLPSRITTMNVANEQHGPLLMIGSDDGAVRVWRGTFDEESGGSSKQEQPELLTAWTALSGLVPGAAGPGLVTNWRQSDGLLLASGDVGVIRVWDVEHERQRQDIATDASITCLCGLPTVPAVVCAGRTDGGITMYDIRVGENGKAVVALKDHSEWVVDLFSPSETQANQKECTLISGSGAGDVKLWDVRMSSSNGGHGNEAGGGVPSAAACIKTIQTSSTDMSALAVHGCVRLYASNQTHGWCISPCLFCCCFCMTSWRCVRLCRLRCRRGGLFGAGSCQQQLQVYQWSEERELATIRYHGGFLRQRIGPVTCLAFHPTELLLAAGATGAPPSSLTFTLSLSAARISHTG